MVAAFTSHRSLWEKCANQFDNFVIFEHDCILDQALPSTVTYTREHNIISFGAPSYGKYNTPTGIGVVPLTSKQYFPGAHCYMLTPKGAKEALKAVQSISTEDIEKLKLTSGVSEPRLFDNTTCSGCLKKGLSGLKCCSRCKSVFYCSYTSIFTISIENYILRIGFRKTSQWNYFSSVDVESS